MNVLITLLVLCITTTVIDCECVNKTALSQINAFTYRAKTSQSEKHNDISFYHLNGYYLIDVTKANVTQLCEGMIKNFQHLEVLSFIGVNLSVVDPGAFETVPRLKYISLTMNSIKEIRRGVFKGISSLETVYLTKNEISIIEEGAFSDLPKLKSVHLDHNKLTQLNGNLFSGSPEITLIDFNFNLITSVNEKSFSDLQLSHKKPLSIFLKKNQIQDVKSTAFQTISNPIYLHVESNEMTFVSDVFFNLPRRSRLYLDRNQIRCISEEMVEHMYSNETVLSLKGNPLDCQCIGNLEELFEMGFFGDTKQYHSVYDVCQNAGGY